MCKDELEEKNIKVSTTDNESGYYHRDNKEKGFMYLDHSTLNVKCNIIVDCYVTKGNVHDAVPFVQRADSKQNHGYRYAMNKVVQKNKNYTWLICAAQNMKNIAIKKDKVDTKSSNYILIFIKYMNSVQITSKI